MSASGVARARKGARTLCPASTSPAYAMKARITSLPTDSGGRNGIGGAGITFAIVDSSSGAASERDPAHADGARVPEADGEAMLAQRGRELDRRQARFGPDGPARHVDLERLEAAQIEHDPAFGRAVARVAVAAAPHGELKA